MIQGTPENVAALIERARRGPPKAEVLSVDMQEGSGEFGEFTTLPTAE